MRIQAVLGGLALVLVASSADARELKKEAQLRLDAGLREYDAGHYERAIKEFEAAFSIDPDPDLLLAWAQAERLAGRCEVAVPRYRRYLESKPGAEGIALARSGIDLCVASAPKERPKPQVGDCSAIGEQPLPWYKNPIGGAIVVGGAGLGVGTGFLIAASGNRDIADTAQTSDQFEARLERATMQRRVGVTIMVFGAALIGGGLAYHYVTRRKESPSTVVSTDGRSIFVARTF
jgi:tetratricopeptide (TPR) repeat protein